MNFSDSSVSQSGAEVFLRWNSRSMTCVMFSGRCFLYVTFSFQSPDFTHLHAVLNSNILPWRLYCSKWQVLCILLLIKQQILKYCCARLVPDFLYKWNAQQHAQHLEEFGISREYAVFAFISLRFREGFNTCSTNNIRLLRREGLIFQN